MSDSKTNMKLTAICDKCGVVGTAEEIQPDYDGRDLCQKCKLQEELDSLQASQASLREWLDATHLKRLGEMEKRISELRCLLDNAQTLP